MTDEELIEQTEAGLVARNIPYGKFWKICRSKVSFTVVWFWAAKERDPNPSCQFDEEKGELLWCC